MCSHYTCAEVLAAITGIVFTVSVFCVGARPQGCFPPSLPLFPLFTSVTGACPPFGVGAHGWAARICQPWERSPSRSWLPIVEAPGSLRYPTSICDAVVNVPEKAFCLLEVPYPLLA